MKIFDLSSFLKRAPFVLPEQDPSMAVSEATSDAHIKGSGWLKIDGNGYISHVSPEHISIHVPGRNTPPAKKTYIPTREEVNSLYKREEAEQEWEKKISRIIEGIMADKDRYNSGGSFLRRDIYYARSVEETDYVFERFSSKGYYVSTKSAGHLMLSDCTHFLEISW